MSFEIIPPLPASRQLLFAFWCRVPLTSMRAARTAWQQAKSANDANGTPFPPLCGIVPLALFGSRTGFAKTVSSQLVSGGSYDETRWTGPTFALGDTGPHEPKTVISGITFDFAEYNIVNSTQRLDPSFIGVDCRTSRNMFTYNFQYNAYANIAKGVQFFKGADPSEHTNTLFPINDGGVYWSFTEPSFYQDVSGGVTDKEPESVRAFPSPGDGVGVLDDYTGYGFDITPERWHQIILAVKFAKMSATGVAITGTSQVYGAIDTRILTGKQLSFFSQNNNEIISPAGYLTSQLGPFTPPVANTFDTGEGNMGTFIDVGKEAANYSFSATNFLTGPINVPGDAATTRNVQMAEMDIYASFVPTVTKSIVAAFVDENGEPVPTKERDKIFNVLPERRLHGSSNWRKGKLTGSLKGTAQTTKHIEKYKPDPSLAGPQSPADLKKK